MSKLNVGDRVRILDDNDSDLSVGSVHTIHHFDDNYIVILDPDATNIDWYFQESHLELVESDNVNSPSHYIFPGGVEVIQITQHLNFCRGNAIKYLARAGKKDIADELEDLKKARFYVECEIARIEAQSS